ncbi:MAG: D-alanyl-D-alanine carboxypeptidase, partial [Clostridia bacterium]|nr:D-alanyl-D-alanine carboxypeptidase [Clostridia bacterium]
FLVAPVRAGQVVGVLSVVDGEGLTHRFDLAAAGDVPRGSLWRVAWDSVRLFFRNLVRFSR